MNSDPTLDAIAIELGAMQAIAEALAALRDPRTRLRVLQWVNERFNPAPQATDSAEANEMLIGDDPALSVESLYAWFERPRVPRSVQSSMVESESTPALAATALEDAVPALDDDALAIPAFPEPPLADTAVVRSHAAAAVREPHAAREDQTLDSLVRGIATDLKRLAVEWQTT